MCLTVCLNVCVVTGTTRTAGREEQGLAEMKHELFEIKSAVNIHQGEPEQKQDTDIF